MERSVSRSSSCGAATAIALAWLLAPVAARAGCDNIPSETGVFRAAQGSITAPFAVPGQSLQVRVRPQVCDASSAGLGTSPSCVDPSSLRVSVIYEPGGGAPVHVVVLARDCGSASDPGSLQSRVAQWSQQLGATGTATCQAEPALAVTSVDVGTTEECRLDFPFPAATGPSLALPDTLVGPTRIVVEPIANPLPAKLVGGRCADAVATLGSIACVDELYRTDGSCFTEGENRNPEFASFTALPVANDFGAMTAASGRPTLRCALGPEGRQAYCPFDWRGVLCQTDPDCAFEGFPPPQLVEVAFPSSLGSGLDAAGQPAPAGVPLVGAAGSAQSLTYYGTQLPPIFDPGSVAGTLGFFGSTDALQTVLAFQLEAPGRCSGDATPCLVDSGCGDGQTCDLSAPDVRLADLGYCRHPNACAAPGTPVTVQRASGGPVQIPATLYAASTDGFIDLASLNLCRDGDVTCLVRSESFAGRALNADADELDPAVLTLRDSKSGARLPIGLDGQAQGLATVLRHAPPAAAGPFGEPLALPPTEPTVTPVIAAHGSCLALLWAEPWENGAGVAGTDANGDGEIFDPLLRAFCLDASASSGIREVSGAALAAGGLGGRGAASAEPRIVAETRTLSALQGGGEPLVVSGDQLYLLLDDAGDAAQIAPVRVDVTATVPPLPGDRPAYQPAITENGERVCFASEAELVPGARDRNRGGPDIFCRDLAGGVTEVVNRSKEQPKQRPLCEGRDVNANGPALAPSVSADGRLTCYESTATNLLLGGIDKNKQADVFLRNALTCETVRLSVDATGRETTRPSSACALAGAGRFAAFASLGALAAADTDGGLSDVYVTPIQPGTDALTAPTRVGPAVLASAGLAGPAGLPSLSRDGTRVAFEHTRPGAIEEVVVRDLAGATVRDPLGFAIPGRNPRLAADGRQLVVDSRNATTGDDEVFVVDLVTSIARGQLVAAPAARDAGLADLQAESFDGDVASARVAFTSPAPLTASDAGASDDVHVRDTVTQLLKRVGSGAGSPALSADGRAVAYVAPAGASGTGVFRSGPAFGSARGLRLATIDLGIEPPLLEIVAPAVQAAVAGRTAAALAPDGTVHVRSCPPAASCAVQALRAPGSTALAAASAVVASEQLVCALLQGSGRVACAPVGDPQLRELRAGGQPVAGRAIGVLGRHVVLTSGETPARLRTFSWTGADFVPVYASGPGARRFVLGGEGWAAFDRCEVDAGFDLDGDGLDDECRLEVVDLDTALHYDTLATVLPCTNAACDAGYPFRVFRYGEDGLGVLVRFLSSELQEGRQLNGNPDDEIIVRDWTPEREFVLAAVGDVLTGDPLAGLGSGGVFNQGGAVFPSLVGRCDGDLDASTEPTTIPCQDDSDCPAAAPTCGPPFSLLALNDADGDGIFDAFDNCPAVFNPEQGDGDGDGAGNSCDLDTCGDGVVDAREYCDDGARNGACAGLDLAACRALGAVGSFCTEVCTPEVFVEVSEAAVNPDKQGVLPTRLYGTPLLNYGPSRPFDGARCAIAGGCPAEMVDLSTVRLEGVVAGSACTGAGAPPDGVSVGDYNSDGIADVQTKFQVLDAAIERGDDQACITGDFRPVEGRFRDASFETRDGLNVK